MFQVCLAVSIVSSDPYLLFVTRDPEFFDELYPVSTGEPQPNQNKIRPCFRISFFGLPEEIGGRSLLHRRISVQAFRSWNQRRKDFFSRHRAASSKAENRVICQRG
jgi:hypothetical protein